MIILSRGETKYRLVPKGWRTPFILLTVRWNGRGVVPKGWRTPFILLTVRWNGRGVVPKGWRTPFILLTVRWNGRGDVMFYFVVKRLNPFHAYPFQLHKA